MMYVKGAVGGALSDARVRARPTTGRSCKRK